MLIIKASVTNKSAFSQGRAREPHQSKGDLSTFWKNVRENRQNLTVLRYNHDDSQTQIH